MDWDAASRAQDGFTLIELLVTIAIVSIAFVALFAGLSTFFAVSSAQRLNANMDAVVRQYEEQVTSPQTPYAACGANYSSVTLPAGYSFSSGPTIAYWNGTNPANAASFGAAGTCAANNPNGVQQITGTITHTVTPTHSARATFTFTKRNPS